VRGRSAVRTFFRLAAAQVDPASYSPVDADFRIREVNPTAKPAFGDVDGGAEGRDFAEMMQLLWNAPPADELVSIFGRILETGEPFVAPEWSNLRIDRNITAGKLALATGQSCDCD
jgi:hypothetical protein